VTPYGSSGSLRYGLISLLLQTQMNKDKVDQDGSIAAVIISAIAFGLVTTT